MMPEFMPYRLCSYDDILDCLNTHLSGDLLEYALSRMPESMEIKMLSEDPHLPWHNSGGGWNNSDYPLYAIGGAYALDRNGKEEEAERCVWNSLQMIEFAHERIDTPQDQGHTYLLGVLSAQAWARRFGLDRFRVICDDLLNAWGRVALNRMNYYGSFDPISITSRYAIRSVDNALIYYYYLRRKGRHDEAEKAAADINVYMHKYLDYKLTAHRFEMKGWGLDVDGVPFHTGGFGRYESWWKNSGNVSYMGWQEFYIQGNNMFNLLKSPVPTDSLKGKLKEKMRHLDIWFWNNAYRWNTDEPLGRGYGATQPQPMFESVPEVVGIEADEQGRMPWRLNHNVTGGTHHYPVWWTLYYKSADKFRRMIESTVAEIQHANYGDMVLQLSLLSPHFQHAVSRWKEGKFYDS